MTRALTLTLLRGALVGAAPALIACLTGCASSQCFTAHSSALVVRGADGAVKFEKPAESMSYCAPFVEAGASAPK